MRWTERAGWIAFGFAAVAALFAFTVRPVGYDVRAYLIAARALVDGRPLYLAPDAPLVLDLGVFLYPPPVALVFVPFLALPAEAATWTVIALLVGVAAALGAVLLAPLPRDVRPWAAAAIALFFPLLLELNVGNMDLVTVALVLGAWALRDRPVRGGALLAVAVGLKLVAGAVVVFYAAAGRWRQLGWAALTALAITVITLPWLAGAWRDYIGLLARMWTSAISSEAIDIRPDALRGTVELVLPLAGAALAVAVGLAARRSRAESDLHRLALAGAPLVAPAIWYTYLLLALPLLVAEVRALAGRPLLLVLPLIVYAFMEGPLEQKDLRFVGLVACLVLGVGLFARRRA